MKKKWTYILLSFFLLLLIAGGYLFYLFNYKEYDVADSEVEKIIEENFQVTLPSGTELALDREGEIANKMITVSADITDSTMNDGENQTVADIKDKYRPILKELDSLASAKMTSLAEQAIDEYQTKKEKGENISYSYFYQKYMGAAEELEANTDALFENVMALVEQELAASGFNSSYGDSFREDYEATKKGLRKSLYEKMLDNL